MAYEPEQREAMQNEICRQLALGKSLRKITSAEENMPDISTVFDWLAKHADFAEQYARAREAQADTLFDEIIDIAEQYSTTEDALNPDTVQRAKLRIDTRKWVASKLKPKKYGEKIQQEHTGADGAPLQVVIQKLSDE